MYTAPSGELLPHVHEVSCLFRHGASIQAVPKLRTWCAYSAQLSPPGLHIVHVAVEMAPICKVGGLGDVVTALGRAVQEQGHMVEVILPRWGAVPVA